MFPSTRPQACALVALGILLLAFPAAAEPVPLPRPRPLGSNVTPPLPLPPLPPLRPAIAPVPEPPPKPPAPSACQLRLPDIAVVEALPPVIGAQGCGIDDP